MWRNDEAGVRSLVKEYYMSNMLRKINRHKNIDVRMSLKLECPKCKNYKLIPKETFDKMTEKEFKEGKVFLCKECNIRMNPVSVEVD